MRQLDPVTNLVLSALAALGLLASLSLPWYVPSAGSTTQTDGPIERAAWQVGHFFKHDVNGSVSGTDAVGDSRIVLVAAVLAVLVLAGLVAVPAVRKQAEDLLRVAGFLVPAAVVYLIATHSGTSGDVMVHYGTLVSLVVAVFVTSCAFHGATVRSKQNKSPHAVRLSR